MTYLQQLKHDITEALKREKDADLLDLIHKLLICNGR